jgi:hypothetical protein
MVATVTDPELKRSIRALLEKRVSEMSVDRVERMPLGVGWLALAKRLNDSNSESWSVPIQLDQDGFADKEVVDVAYVCFGVERHRAEVW